MAPRSGDGTEAVGICPPRPPFSHARLAQADACAPEMGRADGPRGRVQTARPGTRWKTVGPLPPPGFILKDVPAAQGTARLGGVNRAPLQRTERRSQPRARTTGCVRLLDFSARKGLGRQLEDFKRPECKRERAKFSDAPRCGYSDKDGCPLHGHRSRSSSASK